MLFAFRFHVDIDTLTAFDAAADYDYAIFAIRAIFITPLLLADDIFAIAFRLLRFSHFQDFIIATLRRRRQIICYADLISAFIISLISLPPMFSLFDIFFTLILMLPFSFTLSVSLHY
jgi:hypothetical protein